MYNWAFQFGDRGLGIGYLGLGKKAGIIWNRLESTGIGWIQME